MTSLSLDNRAITKIQAAVIIVIIVIAAIIVGYYAWEAAEKPPAETLVEKARKEGVLSLITSGATLVEAGLYLDDFDDWSNLTLTHDISFQTTAPMIEKVLSEKAAGRYPYDVYGMTDAALAALMNEDLLNSTYWSEGIEAFQGPKNKEEGWICYEYTPNIIMVYEDMPSELKPTDWMDFIDPKPEWAGKIVLTDPRTIGSTYAALLTFYHNFGLEDTRRIFEGIATLDPVIVSGGGLQVHPYIETGEYWIALPSISVVALFGIRDGKPFEIILPESGAPVSCNNYAIANNAPHPNAAKLFLEFVVTEDYAKSVVARARVPSGYPNLVPEGFPTGMKQLDSPPPEMMGNETLQADLLSQFETWLGLT